MDFDNDFYHIKIGDWEVVSPTGVTTDAIVKFKGESIGCVNEISLTANAKEILPTLGLKVFLLPESVKDNFDVE